MWALALNSGGGGKTRFSRSVESMSWLATAGAGPATATAGREVMRTDLWGRENQNGSRQPAGRAPGRAPRESTLSRDAYKRQVAQVTAGINKQCLIGDPSITTFMTARTASGARPRRCGRSRRVGCSGASSPVRGWLFRSWRPERRGRRGGGDGLRRGWGGR